MDRQNLNQEKLEAAFRDTQFIWEKLDRIIEDLLNGKSGVGIFLDLQKYLYFLSTSDSVERRESIISNLLKNDRLLNLMRVFALHRNIQEVFIRDHEVSQSFKEWFLMLLIIDIPANLKSNPQNEKILHHIETKVENEYTQIPDLTLDFFKSMGKKSLLKLSEALSYGTNGKTFRFWNDSLTVCWDFTGTNVRLAYLILELGGKEVTRNRAMKILMKEVHPDVTGTDLILSQIVSAAWSIVEQ